MKPPELSATDDAGFLEPGQLTANLNRPVTRAQLGGAARALLWGLRILVVAVSIMVIYTFISQLT